MLGVVGVVGGSGVAVGSGGRFRRAGRTLLRVYIVSPKNCSIVSSYSFSNSTERSGLSRINFSTCVCKGKFR